MKKNVSLFGGALIVALLVVFGASFFMPEPHARATGYPTAPGGASFPLFATADGSVSAPAYSFQSQPSMGMFRAGPNNLQFTADGTFGFRLAANGVIYMSDGAPIYAHPTLSGDFIQQSTSSGWWRVVITGVQAFRIESGGYLSQPVGGAVASAATVTLTGPIQHVTGTTAIGTINVPASGFKGCVKLIPDAAFTTTTAGNIALASTAIVSRTLEECYDGTKWYPSY